MKDGEFKKSLMSIGVKAVVGAAVIAALLCAVYFLSRPEPEEPEEEEATIYTSNTEDILSIVVSSKEETYTLTKGDDSWYMEGLDEVNLSENLAETLAESLSSITTPMTVADKADDLSQYGLEEPEYIVTLVYADSEKVFYVGSRSGDYYYFKTEGDDEIYLISYDDVYLILSGRDGFLDKVVWSIDTDSIENITVGELELKKDGEDWMEVSPYDMAADSDSVTSKILSPLSTVKAESVYTSEEAQITPESAVTVKTSDSERTLYIQKTDDGYLVTTDTSEYIYRVSESALSFLNVTGFDLISRYLAPVSITEISEIRFTSPDGETVLSIDAPSSEAPIFYKDGEEADETNFRDFYQTLMSLTYNEEGTSDSEPERTITLTKESGTVITLEFSPASEGDYAVKINGSGSFIIRKKAVTDVFGYLDNIKLVG